jgi:hypothetical protein
MSFVGFNLYTYSIIEWWLFVSDKMKISGRHNFDIFTDLLPKTYSRQQIIEFGNYKVRSGSLFMFRACRVHRKTDILLYDHSSGVII